MYHQSIFLRTLRVLTNFSRLCQQPFSLCCNDILQASLSHEALRIELHLCTQFFRNQAQAFWCQLPSGLNRHLCTQLLCYLFSLALCRFLLTPFHHDLVRFKPLVRARFPFKNQVAKFDEIHRLRCLYHYKLCCNLCFCFLGEVFVLVPFFIDKFWTLQLCLYRAN